MAKLKTIGALKKYFGTETRPITLPELKALSKDERADLARLACEAMGDEYDGS